MIRNTIIVVHGPTLPDWPPRSEVLIREFYRINHPLGSIRPEEAAHWLDRARKIKGVRLQCIQDGDIFLMSVEFPRDHPFLRDTAMISPLKFKNIYLGIDIPGAIEMPLA